MSEKTFKKLLRAQDKYQQAKQNFELADKHHVDKAVHELNSSIDRLKTILVTALAEVKNA
jgi:hypothetical protein